MVGMTRRQLDALLRPLRRRVMLMIGRAIVRLADDERTMQALQLRALANETIDGAERFQEYGLTSVPLDGAEAILAAVGGMRQHPVVVAVDDRRHRPTGLEPGDVALYTDQDDPASPHRLLLTRGSEVRILSADAGLRQTPMAISLAAPETIRAEVGANAVEIAANGVTIDGDTTINGNLDVNGDINPTGDVDGVDVSTHRHTMVQSGGSRSGPPG